MIRHDTSRDLSGLSAFQRIDLVHFIISSSLKEAFTLWGSHVLAQGGSVMLILQAQAQQSFTPLRV